MTTLQLVSLINENSLDMLLNRIRGLTAKNYTLLFQHQIIYSNNSKINLTLSSNFIENNEFINLNHRKYTLSNQSTPDPKHNSISSTFTTSKVTGNIFKFLDIIGYKYSHEYVKQGYEFTFSPFVMEIYKVLVPVEKFKVSSSRIVEYMEKRFVFCITCDAVGPDFLGAMDKELWRVAGLFDDIGVFVKLDHRCMAAKIIED